MAPARTAPRLSIVATADPSKRVPGDGGNQFLGDFAAVGALDEVGQLDPPTAGRDLLDRAL
jgi:hypothetical protein